MTTAAATFCALAVACWVGAALLFRSASGSDSFGAGILFWIAVALGVVFALAAALLWLVNLYASGFR